MAQSECWLGTPENFSDKEKNDGQSLNLTDGGKGKGLTLGIADKDNRDSSLLGR